MKSSASVAVAAVVAMLCLSGCALVKVKEPEQITVAQVVSEVTKALQEVNSKRPELYKLFESAEITLETVAQTEDTGEIKLLVISAHSSITHSMAQTIYYKLIPPVAMGITKDAGKNISGALAQAIVRASTEIDGALAGRKDLELKALSGTVKFEVTKAAGGGLEVEVIPVTLSGGHSTSKGVSHSITLNFVIPDKK